MEADLSQAHDGGISLFDKLVQARQLVAGEAEGIAHDLLVQVALDLKDDLANGDAGGPAVEAALALPHTYVVAACVDTNVGGDAHVHAELHTAEALLDGFLGNSQLVRADAPVMVAHADAIVAPHHRGAAHAATRGYPAPAFARLA